MESELKDLNSKPPKSNGTIATVRDDRPLLKSDSLSSTTTTTTTAAELQRPREEIRRIWFVHFFLLLIVKMNKRIMLIWEGGEG
ncbi:lysophosphatidylcholine acyltransferase 1-like, partial [Trifolium medium]|nr:lysophosphatidylcholine acyltransferase 1-like [Trifolium medium]